MDLDVLSRTVTVSWAGEPTSLDHAWFHKICLEKMGPVKFAEAFVAWQSLPRNHARVTLPDETQLGFFMEMLSTNRFSGRHVSATRELFTRTVVFKFLPVALSADALTEALSKYGKVISHKFCHSHGVLNGTREVVMNLTSHLPSCVFVLGHRGLVSYQHQPRTCFVCHASGHLRDTCPTRIKPSKSTVASVPLPTVPLPEPVVIIKPLSAPVTENLEPVAVAKGDYHPSVIGRSAPSKAKSSSSKNRVTKPSKVKPSKVTPSSAKTTVKTKSVPITKNIEPIKVLLTEKPPAKSYSAIVKDNLPVHIPDADDEWDYECWLDCQTDFPEPDECVLTVDCSPDYRKHCPQKNT